MNDSQINLKKELDKKLKEAGRTANILNDQLTFSVLPTSFDKLDNEVIGVGGIPEGRIIEISGSEGSGKSTFAVRVGAVAQDRYKDKFIGIADSEGTYTFDWLVANGIDPEKCVFCRSNVQEEVFAQIVAWAKTGLFSLIILDSLGNLMPSKLQARDWYSQDSKTGEWSSEYAVGDYSRLCTNFSKQICMPLSENNTTLLVCNHIRAKIGGFVRPGMPPPTTTPGGHCFGHDTSMHLVFSKVKDVVNKKQEVEGFVSRVRVKRSKVGQDNVSTDDSSNPTFYFKDGIKKSKVYNTIDSAVLKQILLKAGTWYSFIDKSSGEVLNKWQGLDAVRQYYLNNDEDYSKFKNIVDSDTSTEHMSTDEGIEIVSDEYEQLFNTIT
jgi:recombination protein RecA